MYTIDFNELDKKLQTKQTFKFGDYLSQGYELFKKDYSSFIVAFLGAIVMGFIPLCQFIGLANFYKACERIENGEKVSFGDMFNFDKAGLHIMHFLLIFAVGIVLIVPFYIFLIFQVINIHTSGSHEPPVNFLLMYPYIFFVAILTYILSTALFFVPALITFSNETSFNKILSYSWKLVKQNFFMILLFIFVTTTIGSLGAIACYIGLIFTMPLTYCMHYMCFKDLLFTHKHDEINEISGI